MTANIQQILDLSASWALFPCQDKRPLTPHGLKDATQDQKTISDWWQIWPDAQIGVPLGENTGSFVLDIDLPDGPASLAALEAEHGPLPATWTARTPSGGEHRHFRLPEGADLRNSASRLALGLDIRADGGYVIVPPTPGYQWTSEGVPLANAPEWLLKLLTTPKAVTPCPIIKSGSTTPYGRSALDAECGRVALAPEGSRNDTLNSAAFSIAQLVAGGHIDRAEAEASLLLAAQRAGLPTAEASKTLASAFNKGEMEPRSPEPVSKAALSSASSASSASSFASASVSNASANAAGSSAFTGAEISHMVDEYIEQSSGMFTTFELCQWCGLTTREQRNAVSSKLLRNTKKKSIERVGTRHGQWRRIESESQAIDFMASDDKPMDVALPFGLSGLVELMPGNIVLVAGEPNAGKTALMLNIVRENMHKSKVHYFSSEMGAQEMKKRISKFDMPLSAWTFKAYERSDNFHDAIVTGPGNINVVDFLEVSDEFYKVGGMLKAIHDRLNGALAVVCLQKNKGTDTGLGGGRSLEKPRLYLALEPGLVKIVKAKNWATAHNPNGLERQFKIVDGCKLLPQGDWRKSETPKKQPYKAA